MKKFDESMVGKKVRFIDKESHEDAPEFYPPVGTIGEVVKETPYDYRVKWPKNSGVGKDCGDGKEYSWFCLKSNVEPVEDSVSHMTDAEVFKMLEPKLEKNSLNPRAYFVAENHRNEVLYSPKDFERAVSLIYRIGYGRGQKGRPFEYQNVNAEPKEEEDKLVGNKVVLTNPESDSTHFYNCNKGDIGVIGEDEQDDNIVGVNLEGKNERYYFLKSELMLIVDDEPKKGDKVVFLDEVDSDSDSEFWPPVGTILDYCGDEWYYTNDPWDTMSEVWKKVMNKNHKWGHGLRYLGSEVKKVIPLC